MTRARLAAAGRARRTGSRLRHRDFDLRGADNDRSPARRWRAARAAVPAHDLRAGLVLGLVSVPDGLAAPACWPG
ncbi:MAG: hypothetical protein U0R79_10780 [Propionicimonas sp.]